MARFGINLRLKNTEEDLEESVLKNPGYELRAQVLGRLLVGSLVLACIGLLGWHFYMFGSLLLKAYGPLVPFYALNGVSMVCTGLFFALILLDPTYGAGVPEPINLWPFTIGSILRVVANYMASDQLPEYYVNYMYQFLIEIVANGVIYFIFMTEDGCDNFMHFMKPWIYAKQEEHEPEI